MQKNNKIDFWDRIEDSYQQYPTVIHRKRLVLKAMDLIKLNSGAYIFDYGCGQGEMLEKIKKRYGLGNQQLGGCDNSKKAIEAVKRKFPSSAIFYGSLPVISHKCEVIICSEVIEHVKEYTNILNWAKENIAPDGLFILTTQSGKMHAIDEYSGHLRTFEMRKLKAELERLGFEILEAYLWGFPLFSFQKYLTDFHFNKIKKSFLEGRPGLIKKLLFKFVYGAYFIHDLIKYGPQIVIAARRSA